MVQADESVAGNTGASIAEGSRSASAPAGKPLVAVYGATSKQGRSVAVALLRSGRFRVRILTRNRASKEARNLEALGAEIAVVPMGLGHFRQLVTAFAGAEAVYLMTPQLDPKDNLEFALGKELADAAVEAGVSHIVFSTLENVDKITSGKKHAPHFTDKALVADYIRSLPVSHSFVMLAYFYTNLLEYYVPRFEGGKLLMPIYLPEDFRAPFVDPVTATGPAVLELMSNPGLYGGKTLPVVGDVISPREMVETFQRVTGIEAEYRNAYSRENLRHYFPDFASNDPLVDELVAMVEYSVEYGYFSTDRDLEWSRRLNPSSLNWEQFLLATQWRGEKRPFGG
ncbi:uncharacterized protein YbjT (DUF2867 family) [Sphingomonas zeicaulis]|uniref:NmrA/HSCARG family protein n=1 Tax=Sphingomonas zeicaulis TaxID=1632740 RepID=UPI003D21B082